MWRKKKSNVFQHSPLTANFLGVFPSLIQWISQCVTFTDKLFSCSLLRSFNRYWFFRKDALFIQPWIQNQPAECFNSNLLAQLLLDRQKQKLLDGGGLCKLKDIYRRADQIFYASQYLGSWSRFLPDNPPCECWRLQEPSVKGTRPVIPQRALTSFFHCLLSVSDLKFPIVTDFSPFSFILSRSDGGTPVGFSFWKKRKDFNSILQSLFPTPI